MQFIQCHLIVSHQCSLLPGLIPLYLCIILNLEKSPLGTFKIHNRWISDIKFLSTSKGYLLTASDDGTLLLSEVVTSNLKHKEEEEEEEGEDGGEKYNAEQMSVDGLKPISRLSTQIHQRGIFGMDELGGQIVTGSKDGSIAISTICGDGILQKVHVMENSHDNIIKCVRWATSPISLNSISSSTSTSSSSSSFDSNSSNIFASCGNDLVVKLYDCRRYSNILSYSNVHSQVINSLNFHPTNPFIMFSSSADKTISIYDIRNNKNPLHILKGHHKNGRSKDILCHPTFLKIKNDNNNNNDSYHIGTIGVGTPYIHFYSLESGLPSQQLYVGGTPTCIQRIPYDNDNNNNVLDKLVVATGNNSICILELPSSF